MKLSLDALKERAEGVASEELLGTISGGTENACHVVDSSQEVQSMGEAVLRIFWWLAN